MSELLKGFNPLLVKLKLRRWVFGWFCCCWVTNFLFSFQPGPEIRPKIHDLPEECVREIILRIADHRDLEVGLNQ